MFDEAGVATKVARGSKGRQGNQGIGSSAAARGPLPFLHDIRNRAHAYWVAAGRPPGDSVRFWLRAEQEMQEGR